MMPMGESRHRVVIQLKDIILEDDNEENLYVYDAYGTLIATEQIQRPMTTTELEIQDNRTLQLTRLNTLDVTARRSSTLRSQRILQFDCVGAASDIQTRAEYNSMLDLLMLKHYNCCLLQFTLQRECQVPFLTNLLVSEIDQRLQRTHSGLHGIRVDLHDMRKFEVVNLFAKSSQSSMRQRQRPRNHFNNTLELLKWLQSDYAHMWSMGRGHTILDVQLHYTAGRNHRIYRTKFCIVQIHTMNMDTDTRTSLKNFFESQTMLKRLKHTNTIIDCLREYFTGPDLWRMWMFFEVPISNSIGLTTDEMLSIASAAYAGALNANVRTNASSSRLLPKHVEDGDSDATTMADDTSSKPLVRPASRTASMVLKKTHSVNSHDATTVSASMPVLKSKSRTHAIVANGSSGDVNSNTRGMTVLSAAIKASEAQIKRLADFSTKDLDNLSNWYAKIDGHYSVVIAAMEIYYKRKYESKIGKIGREIQQIVRTGTAEDPTNSYSVGDINETGTPEELKELYNKYLEAIKIFRNLEKQAGRTQFSEQLQVYLKTKLYELTQNVLKFKMHQLENCRTQLVDVIKKEINALKTLKSTTASMHSIQRRVNIQSNTT